ncbi:MAG: hypothetical protein ACK4RF_03335 [Cyclobacteriaceae bacterium]
MSTPTVLAEHIFTEDLYKTESRFLVLIPVAWQELTEAEKNLLVKVVEAIHLSISAVQILSVKEAEASLLTLFKPSFVLSFGVPVANLDSQYVLSALHGTEIIWADRLREIDQTRKEKLWPLLKSKFLAQ